MRRLVPPLCLAVWLALPMAVAAHGSSAPAPTFPSVLWAWSFDVVAVAMIAVSGGAYLWAVRRVNAAHPANPHRRIRTWCWFGGLTAIGLALLSPIEAYEGLLFSVHMTQHMLLQLVAAPLLLAGGPITLALRASTPPVRRRLLSVLQSRVVHAISFPLVAWILFAAANWGWHFSTLYDEALESTALHYLQHATLFATALLFWWPVIGVDPSPWRLPFPVKLLYLFLAMPQSSFLGIAIMEAPRVLYPHYLTNLREWGLPPLDDQALGGVIMWTVGDLAFLIGMGVVVALWVRHEDRRTAREDRRMAAETAAATEAWHASQRGRGAQRLD